MFPPENAELLFIANMSIMLNIFKKEASQYWKKQGINSKKRWKLYLNKIPPPSCNCHNMKNKTKQSGKPADIKDSS